MCDGSMASQQSECAVFCASSRTTHEFINSSRKRERPFFDFVAQIVPGFEAILARDHKLCVVQSDLVPGERAVCKDRMEPLKCSWILILCCVK